MRAFIAKTVGVVVATGIAFAFAGAYKSTNSAQLGNSGLGMEQNYTDAQLAVNAKNNTVPPALPPASSEGQLAVDAYKNVQVLGHITSGEMTRLMTAMTIWVAPQQGCAYCHAPQRDASGNVVKDSDGNPQADANNLYSDDLYTKRVARRMLLMTMHINSSWKTHVKETGVTCYTCHRGNPVPTYIWYNQAEDSGSPYMGNRAHQNAPATLVGLASLPNDPYQTYYDGDEGIRIQSTEPLPIDNRLSIKQAEWTYGLMMSISGALGVNCTYCHNSRSFGVWDASPPARNTAWYGIRMVRDLNQHYLDPLTGIFPAERLGPEGDGPKLSCVTCHQGVFKPLLGASMLKDYMVLAEAKPQPQKTPVAPPQTAPAPGAAPGTPAATPTGAAPAQGAARAPAPTGAAPAQGAAPAPAQGATPVPTGTAPAAPAPAAAPTQGAAPAQAVPAPAPVPK